MNRVTRDRAGMGTIDGLQTRAKFNQLIFDTIWLPKEIREMVDGKGYQDIEPWLLNSISEKVYNSPRKTTPLTDITKLRKKVKDSIEQSSKYNL